MTDDGSFKVHFATGRSLNLAEVLQRKEAVMPDGGHAWVIHTVFALDDPEQALDDMTLGGENFVGVSPIHCLLCGIEYVSLIRYFKCPQKRPGNDR